MALPTYYATGTASVANGSTDVTGSGTSWLTSIRAGDLFGTHKGMPVRVSSVNSNTSLTLAYGWAGTTQTDAAYEIQLTPRTVGVQQAVLELLEILSNGNLSSLSELASAADKLPYFTGVGTSALTDITSKARSLLGNSTTLDMLATLGPVFGGTAPVPSGAGVGLADGNFNVIAIPGVYTIDGAWTNGPLASGASATYAGVLVVTASSLNNGYWQELLIDDQRFMRFTSTSGGGSGWSAWTEMSSGGSLPTPTMGDAGKVVAVNATEDGFELEALAASPLPTPTTGDAGKVVAVNATEDGFELEVLTSALPTPTTGDAGKVVSVKATEDGYQLETLSASSNLAPFVDVASATTVDLGAASSTSVNITGTTGITSFGTSAPDGSEYLLKFAGALTITASASIVSYTGADITTFAGMQMRIRRESSAWRVAWFTPSVDTSAAKLNVEDQVLTGGARVTSKDLGTITTGTVTPDPGDRPLQHYTNNGAHTLAPGTNNGSYLIDITNGASAGAITTSGWTKVAGDAFTTTSGHKFRCHASVGNAGSYLVVGALQ